MRRRVLLPLAALILGAWAGTDAAEDFTTEAIFTDARGHVHASSIVETPAGALLVAWYENGSPDGPGPFEGQDMDKRQDVRISGARRGRPAARNGAGRSPSPTPPTCPTTTRRSASMPPGACGSCTPP